MKVEDRFGLARWVFPLILLFISGCTQFPVMDQAMFQQDDAPGAGAVGPAQVRAPMEAGYQIGPEDTLGISVWREDTLQREVIVRPDGMISFPLAGDVPAAGKTAEEVAKEIKKRLAKYMPDPVVSVSVNKVAGYKVYVLGQVTKPGEYTVGRYVDVMQALTLAGGLTPYASENGIKILRRENGKEVVLPFRYSAVRNGDSLEHNIMLRSGDVVVVP